jgi:hypothetical protein
MYEANNTGWYEPPDTLDPIDNWCDYCGHITPHIPTTKTLDSMGCVNGRCDVCSGDNLIEIVDPDHARDVRDDR